jgi:hypothetical protein
MPEKIGKYEILGRIGRGGMGTIFRAHDPVLDRAVALKMISPDVEVTDELRTRFFREAQACARLSHPNIVTVYDMGEDDGRLFIVMELLEGQELRRLIADRSPMALEDKISIMAQVCDGLSYAHQMGVVHRDVKPGNILVLRNGQVKILDFGIARIVATEAGLTRTGLIMGTLRYISPEQVRGRVDQRSDIFSAGAVFYELLSFRPPFSGEDPMQILDQLRTESPAPLTQLDATIPLELAAIVERAMQKDPAQRFPDFEQMRWQLDEVQRRLGEEAQIVRGRVREGYARLRDLQAVLADRIGFSAPGEPPLDERGRLGTLRALERDLAERIESSKAKIARAEVLASAFERGSDLLRAGQFADAVSEFEAIVADLPEHVRALEALSRARAQAEGERRRQLAAKLVQDARKAFDEGGYTLCLEILKQADEIPQPIELTTGISSLREAAEVRLAAQRQEREAAEQASGQASANRARAVAADAAEYARDLWDAAETKLAEGQRALRGGSGARAAVVFEEAAALYRRAEEAGAAQKRERRRAEAARDRTGEPHRAAEEADAERHAPTSWGDAARAFQSGQGLLERGEWGRATEVFERALALYRQAEAEARGALRREREQAEGARRTLSALRDRAASVNAEAHASAEWAEAMVTVSAGEASLARGAYSEARHAFEQARALYSRAEERARETVRMAERALSEAEKSREASGLARRAAGDAQAAKYASEPWLAGENTWGQAIAALERREYDAARSLFGDARRHYAAAAQSAAVGAEAEARRADAMVNDARRSFDGGDFAACLRRLEEVLALRPSHAGAEALRRQAQERLQRPGAARAVPGAADESPTVLDQPTILADRTRLDAPTGLVTPAEVDLDPPTVLDAPTVLMNPTVPDAPTVLAAPPAANPSMVFAKPTSMVTPLRAGEARTEIGDTTIASATVRDTAGHHGQDPGGVETDRRAGASARPGWSRARILVAGLAVLVVLVLGVSYWLAMSPGPRVLLAPQPGREAAEEMRRRMIVARDGAAQADAERLAPVEFGAASEKARTAEEALSRRDTATAQQGYGQAADGFVLARNSAERVTKQQRAVGVAESRTGEARRAAASADAPALAAALWAKAGATQRDAEEAARQSAFDRAAALFGEAERTYRDAQNAAGTARVRAQEDDSKRREIEAASKAREQTILKADAEQARGQAASARQSAEHAGAPRYAPKLFASAQGREGEASTALDHSNYPSAIKGFGEAKSGYDAAGQEARREKGLLIAATDVAHREALDRRGDAVKAEAETYAKESFELARKKEAEGDDQVKREDLPVAAQTYRDAAKGYAAARDAAQEAFARTRTDADRARDGMQREKAGARPGSLDYDKAVEQERRGNDSYDRRDFRAATGLFKGAGELYAKARIPPPVTVPPKPSPPFPQDDAAKIKAALGEFKIALESRDLARLQRVWTGMTGTELSRQRETFEYISQYTFDFTVRTTQINGNLAEVRLFRKDTMIAKNGEMYRSEADATFTLKRLLDRWTIDRIQ